jgi:transposase
MQCGSQSPLDMRAGMDTALARVVRVFGAARPHHAYLFANRRANRIKVFVHDRIGVWLASPRLYQGKFIWPNQGGTTVSISRAQFDALVLGLPWQRIGESGAITAIQPRLRWPNSAPIRAGWEANWRSRWCCTPGRRT